MTNGNVDNLLIPNVSKLPKHKKADVSKEIDPEKKSEFQNLLKEQIGESKKEHGIRLSLHATKRLQERDLSIDNDEFVKLKGAIDKLKTKGGKDSLVVTDKAAYIVDVDKNTVVTAVDKEKMAENVFTKIDSTMFVN